MAFDRLAEWRQWSSAFRQGAQQGHSLPVRVANRAIRWIGSFPYLIFHVGVYALWLVINFDLIHGLIPRDSVWFALLTLIPTVEQIPLVVIILITENRAAETSELRNELNLQLNILNEEELRKMLQMLTLIGEKLDIQAIVDDPDLQEMHTAPIDLSAVEQHIEQELNADSQGPQILTGSHWTPHRE